MADNTEYIERGAFLKKCAEAWGYAGVTIKAIEGIADECTAADVVEVVRCKDCVKRNTADCAMWFNCMKCGGQWSWESDNGFCNFGERKEQT